jgi:hypothetical protein
MPRTLALALALAAAPMLPTSARAEAPVEGRVETDTGRIEILGRRVRVGEKIELPEGWLRVEEEGTEDRNVGSFAVVPAQTLAATASAIAAARAAMGSVPTAAAQEAPAPAAAPRARPCRAERTAYLRELWRASGIEVDDPDAVIEGLEAGTTGPQTGFYWFALQTDPFRPLAYSSALRERAEALARCAKDSTLAAR